MTNETPFQEKPDWKGKLSQLSGKLTSIFKKDKSTNIPSLPGATGMFQSSDRSERTLTQFVVNAWKKRVSPKLAGAAAVGVGRFGGGVQTLDLRSRLMSERSLNTGAVLISILLITYIAADLTALIIDRYIPEPPPVRTRGGDGMARRMKSPTDYQAIISRNLFNSRGLIPGDDLPATPTDSNNAPVKTSLPFNLVGTLVMKNELRSIATIEDTGEQRVYPVRVDDEIPGRARIISIEPFRVIFVNPTTGRREYVEIPEDPNAAPRISLNTPGAVKGGVEQSSATNFNVAKTEVDSALSNWEQTLSQARALPYQENGQPAGFQLVQIVPGSIYDKLGLKNRDVLCGVNGDPINDVSKAMELLSLLKTSNRIELCVKRQGKTSSFTYDIR